MADAKKANIDSLVHHLPAEKQNKLWLALQILQNSYNSLLTQVLNYLATPANYPIAFNLFGLPNDNETNILLLIPKGVTLTFLPDFTNSYVYVGTNPTIDAVYTIQRKRLGVPLETIGTITIKTDGSFIFSNVGHKIVTYNFSDLLLIVTPTPQDATLSDVYITLAGRVNKI